MPPAADETAPAPGTPDERIGNLRGATVQVDAARLRRIAVGAAVVTLTVLTVVFLVVGIHKNAQITLLHQRGVPASVTVTNCVALLGGSGSNAAGYACRGTLTLDGRPYAEDIPGNVFYPDGTTVAVVAVPGGSPPLLTTTTDLATSHTSWRVYLAPAILFVLLLLLVGAILVKRHSRRALTS